jgi:membrane protease YdiL (CAAX protease family)
LDAKAIPAMTTIGILLALFGPPIVALVGPKLEGSVGLVFGSIIGLGAIIAIVGCVFAITFRYEHQTLVSLGFQPLRWQSLVFGLGLAAFFMYAFTPAMVWVLARLPFGGFETGLARTSAIPTWLLVITVLIVATAEEWASPEIPDLNEGPLCGRFEHRLILIRGSVADARM